MTTAAAIEALHHGRRRDRRQFRCRCRDVDGAERSATWRWATISSGVARTGGAKGLKSSYAKIESSGRSACSPGSATPISFRMKARWSRSNTDADRIVPLTLIPPVIAHSGATISIPEYSAIRETTRIPLAVRGTHGQGRTVYFCQPDGSALLSLRFSRIWDACLRTPCARRSATHADIEVDAPEFVDVTLMVQPGAGSCT